MKNKWLMLIEAEKYLQDFILHFENKSFKSSNDLSDYWTLFFSNRNILYLADCYRVCQGIRDNGWFVTNIYIDKYGFGWKI